MVPNADCAIEDEVHLEDFLLFVINHVLFLFLAEVARFQSESNVVQELAVLVGLWIEEEAEIVKDVIEQVMNDDATFDLPWKSIDELVVLLHLTQSVVLPVVLEMLVDLPIKTVRQRFVTEPCEQGHPIVQFECLLLVAKILVESGDDLDEGTHDVGEECYAGKHDKDAEDHLMARYGVQVSVTHRR